MDRSQVAHLGENFAERYLKKQSFKIVERNWEMKRWGEIDRIVIDKDTLVFVEVKTRVGEQKVEPWEAIDRRKLNALHRSALIYSQNHQNLPKALRIDVISIKLDNQGNLLGLEHFKNVLS